MNPLFTFVSMTVAQKASAGPQTRQAPVKLAISTHGWPSKLPHSVQTDESRVLARSTLSDLEGQDSFAIFAQKKLISSNILPILNLFQNSQFHFCGGGVDGNLLSSYFHFHVRFRCDAENDSMTGILYQSRSEMNHGVQCGACSRCEGFRRVKNVNVGFIVSVIECGYEFMKRNPF
jgi:hypothetical protein